LELADAKIQLAQVIERVGFPLDIPQFMALVSDAFLQAQRVVDPDLDTPRRFRHSRSYYGFANALKIGESYVRRPLRVLVLGCGNGYAGLSSDYAASVARDVLSIVETIDQAELSPEMLDDKDGTEPYDLVITHSLVHFVLDLRLLFNYMKRKLRPHGQIVLAHEPNAAFWSDNRVQSVRRLHRQRRTREQKPSRGLKPWGYVAKFREKTQDTRLVFEVANNLLRTRHPFRSELTPAEIVAIADPHFPSNFSFRLGEDGLDARQLRMSYLPEFALRWHDTSGYPEMDYAEAVRLGLPGSVFSALYGKIRVS
jgi:SAM-dependent methyltransferase